MRDRIWLALRNSALLRALYALPFVSAIMKRASFVLVPPTHRSRVRVQSGPGRGLIVEINPRWEHAFWEGQYESKVQRLITELCKPGTVFFDVGANFGYYSLLATRCGASAIAFEPDARMAESLNIHARLNGMEGQIRIERKAVFSQDGEVFLEPTSDLTLHGNAHVQTLADARSGAIRIPCTTLDSYVAANGAPSLVKIDVEGAERNVLAGAESVFQDIRPPLLCEVHDHANEDFARSWLHKKRYEFSWLDSKDKFPRELFAWPHEKPAFGATLKSVQA